MAEYDPVNGGEVETEPGSRGRVLRNRLGIVRKREMDQAEFEALVRVQEEYLQGKPFRYPPYQQS